MDKIPKENMTKRTNKIDSLKKRYSYKLIAGLIRIPISLVTAAFMARSLGPAGFGNFTFLTQFFAKIVNFFESGTSIGFYTKLSQRLQEKGLIKFYWLFVFIINIMVIICVPVVFILNKQNFLWPDQSVKYIWMALVFSLLTWNSQIVMKIVDAYGFTVKGEIIKTVRIFSGFVLILILFFTENLNLTTFFLYHYFGLFIIIIGSSYILKKKGVSVYPNVKLELVQIKKYITEFWIYSHPLITYSFVALIVGVLDIWLLQKFAGSVQQGFFGLAFKISGVCFVFASSMTPLITREFSIAFGNSDMDKMRSLFTRYIPLIYASIAFLVIFISINSELIAFLFGGTKFIQANTAIAIMVLYPMHQTYGQLSGSVFYATGQTKIYRNIGITLMLTGLPLLFFLLAPNSLFGLDMGATGLAIKMVSIQFISVNVQLFFNAKFLKISFLKFFSHQIYTIAIFVIIAYLSLNISIFVTGKIIISFLINGIIYTSLSTGILFMFPAVFSLSRKELNQYIVSFKMKFLSKIRS